MKIVRLFLMLCLAGLVGLTSCRSEHDSITPVIQPVELTLEQQLAQNPQYSTLYAGLRATGLLAEFKPGAVLTVLAPNNTAFERLPNSMAGYRTAASIGALPAAKLDELRRLLQYHLLPGQPLAALSGFGRASVTTLLSAPSPARQQLTVSRFTDSISVNSILVNLTPAKLPGVVGGTLQPMRQVLIPPAQSLAELIQLRAQVSAGEYTYFWQALQRPAMAGLLQELSSPQTDYTVLLPTDAGLLGELSRRNPAWTQLASIPDADLLAFLRLHIIPQHFTSLTLLLSPPMPTLAGNTFATTLRMQGSVSYWGSPSARYSFAVITDNYLGNQRFETNFAGIDQAANNGVIHLLDGAIKQ